jgi:hypothetical protein
MPYGTPLPRETDSYLDSFKAVIESRSVRIGGMTPSPVTNMMGRFRSASDEAGRASISAGRAERAHFAERCFTNIDLS